MGMKRIAVVTIASIGLAGCATADQADKIVVTGSKADGDAWVPSPPPPPPPPPTPVPEPGMLGLFGLAALGAVGLQRRRRRKVKVSFDFD